VNDLEALGIGIGPLVILGSLIGVAIIARLVVQSMPLRLSNRELARLEREAAAIVAKGDGESRLAEIDERIQRLDPKRATEAWGHHPAPASSARSAEKEILRLSHLRKLILDKESTTPPQQ
jgi:hypothetical protein